MNLDRLPPHSLDAEQGVLGCILEDPKQSMPLAVKDLVAGPGMFYDLRHRSIFEAMVEIWNESAPIDIITLSEVLKRDKKLDGIGGILYLSECHDSVPSAINLAHYIKILVEKFALRTIIKAGSQMVANGYADGAGSLELISECTREMDVAIRATSLKENRNMRELVKSQIDAIEDRVQNPEKPVGLHTGFPDFDRMTGGLRPAEMVVLAARPSMGKTSMAMNIVEHVAGVMKIPATVFSLEMTADSLTRRLICSCARLDSRDIDAGIIAESHYARITHAAGVIGNAPITIYDDSMMTMSRMRAQAKIDAARHGTRLFVIDFLQIIQSEEGRRFSNRQEELTMISAGCKSMGKETGATVIVLSQLNRDIEREKNRKPRMSDLRESGAIEQDADMIAFLHKKQVDEDQEDSGLSVPVDIVISKNRNGPTGDVEVVFLKKFTRYESSTRNHPSDSDAF